MSRVPAWMSAPEVGAAPGRRAKWMEAPEVDAGPHEPTAIPAAEDNTYTDAVPFAGVEAATVPPSPPVLSPVTRRIQEIEQANRENATVGPMPPVADTMGIQEGAPRSEFVAGVKQGAVRALGPSGPRTLGIDPELGTPARGAAGFVGEQLGGLAGGLSPTSPQFATNFAGLGIGKAASAGAGMTGRVIGSAIEGGTMAGTLAAGQQAAQEDWTGDPVGSLKRTLAAFGVGAGVGGVAGAGMHGVGELMRGSEHPTDHPVETPTNPPEQPPPVEPARAAATAVVPEPAEPAKPAGMAYQEAPIVEETHQEAVQTQSDGPDAEVGDRATATTEPVVPPEVERGRGVDTQLDNGNHPLKESAHEEVQQVDARGPEASVGGEGRSEGQATGEGVRVSEEGAGEVEAKSDLAPKSDLAHIPDHILEPESVSRFRKIADEAAARIKARQTPRGESTGGGTLGQDIVDAGIWLGAKFAETGERFLKKQAGYAKKLVEENYPHLQEHFGKVFRVARSIARQSYDAANRKFDEGKLESAVGKAITDSAAAPEVKIKQRIRDTTGQVRTEEKTVGAHEAYVHGLREAEKAANKASREQRRVDLAEANNRLDILRDTLKREGESKALRGAITEREKGRAAVEKVEDKAATIETYRREAYELVKNHLPQSVQGELLSGVQNATTAGGLFKVATRAKHAMLDYEIRGMSRNVRSVVRGSNPSKMLEQYRLAVKQAAGLAKALRAQVAKGGLSLAEKRAVLDEFRTLRDTVKEARHRQKADNEITVQGKVLKREQVVANGVNAIEKKPELPARADLPEARRASLVGRARQSMLTPDSVGALTGDPTLRRIISEDLWDGETRVNGDTQRGMDELKKNITGAGFKWGSDELQRLSAAAAGKDAKPVSVHLSGGQEMKATPAELMSLYATLTDEDAGRNITKGAPITFARERRGDPLKVGKGDILKVKLALDQINPALVGVVERAKQYVEKAVRPGVFDAFRDQKGYDLEAVKGYWRTRRNMDNTAAPGLVEPMRKHLNRALENLGFLKERSPEFKTPYVIGDFFNDYHDIVYQGAVVAHMTRLVRNAEMVFRDTRMRRAVETRFGEGMNRRLDQIVENGKLIFVEPKSGAEKVAATLNRNLAKALLTINPRTYVKQLGGVFKLVAVIDAKDVAAASRRSVAYSPEVSVILKDSPYFRNRYQEAIFRRATPSLGERGPILGQSPVKEAAKRLGTLNPKKAYGAFQDITDRIELLNNFDAVSARVAIGAKLAEAKRLGIKDAAGYAAREAEYAIRRTNNTSSPLDMSGVASDLRGSLGSSLLMFTSDSNKSVNMLATAYQKGPKAFAIAATAVALDLAWGAAVGTVLGRRGIKSLVGSKGDNDREAGWGETFARAFIRNAAGMVYGLDSVADAVGAGVDKAMGRMSPDHPYLEGPLTSTLEDLLGGIRDVVGATGESGQEFQSGPREGKSKAVVHARGGAAKILGALGRLGGAPLDPLYRMGKTVYDNAIKSPEE